MRLSWNEIRVRAARFAEDWKDARYERGESQTFYNEFFEVFGATRRRVASFEEPVKRLGKDRGFIDLFWKVDYFPGLKEHELPRHVLVSDFQTFELLLSNPKTPKTVKSVAASAFDADSRQKEVSPPSG